MSDNHRPDGYNELQFDPQYDTHADNCSCIGCTANAMIRRRAKDAAMTKQEADTFIKVFEAMEAQGTHGPGCTCQEFEKQRALCPVCDKDKFDRLPGLNSDCEYKADGPNFDAIMNYQCTCSNGPIAKYNCPLHGDENKIQRLRDKAEEAARIKTNTIASNGPFTATEMAIYDSIIGLHNGYMRLYEHNGSSVDQDWIDGIHKLQDVMLNRAMRRMYPNLFNK